MGEEQGVRGWGRGEEVVQMDNLHEFKHMRYVPSPSPILGDTRNELKSRGPRCSSLPLLFLLLIWACF